MKKIILPWLTLQNSIHTLLMRYVRIRDVDEMFYASVAVLMMEFVKLFFCTIAVYCSERKDFKTLIQAIYNKIFKNKMDTIKVMVPTLLYTVQNNIVYVGASHLDSASFVVIYQLRILFAAIFSVLILKKSQNFRQCIAILCLFIGVSIVSFQMNQKKGNKSSSNEREQDPLLGIFSVVLASMISGLAGVLLEKIYKDTSPTTVWMRNIQMSVASIPSSYAMIYIKNGNDVAENGYFYGFDFVIWFMVFWLSIGGLTIAFCLKYADNILKDFATANSILFVTAASIFIFDFVPNLQFLLGLFIVLLSTFAYSNSIGQLFGNGSRSKLILFNKMNNI